MKLKITCKNKFHFSYYLYMYTCVFCSTQFIIYLFSPACYLDSALKRDSKYSNIIQS